MKKLLLSAASLFAFGTMHAQVAKTPMIEHFTSASCGPCVAQNANMETVLAAYSGNYVKVAHQGNYSFDPMENQFPQGSAVRHAYYGGGGVPNSALNGTDGYPSTIVTGATLAAVAAQTTPYEITVSQTWTSATSIDLTVVVANTTSSPVSTANKIFISMIEETVTFPSAPGSNGETEFRYVLRQMYDANTGAATATTGSALGTIAANSSETFNLTITPPTYIADLTQVSFAAYIQSASSNDMEQAGKSNPGGVPGLLDLATATNSTVGDGYCNYSFDPVITLTNNTAGTDVTTFTVQYDINGGTPVQETYNGTLTSGSSETINFPNINLPVGESSVNYSVVSVNGGNAYSGGTVAMASETFSKISATASATPISEGFEGADFVTAPAGAIADNPNGIDAFSISDTPVSTGHNLGGNGNSISSFFWDFYTISNGESSKIVFEKLDFTGQTGNELKFTHAHAQYGTSADKLKVNISTDCGSTWINVFDKSGAALATAPAHSSNRFWPEINEWVDNVIDLSAYDNEPEVMIAFEAISNYGNTVFIDDINTDFATGVNTLEDNSNTLSIMPNPVVNNMTVAFTTENAEANITIKNVQGQVVKTVIENTVAGANSIEVNTTDLSAGVYFLSISSETNVSTQRFVINR
jgi:hypothetical protein